MPVDLSAYRVLYVKTASDLVRRYGVLVGKADQTEELHRICHSLKGQSLAMGYTSIGRLFYLLELYFAHILHQNAIPHNTPPLPAMNTLLHYVEHVEDVQTQSDIDNLSHSWQSSLDTLGVHMASV